MMDDELAGVNERRSMLSRLSHPVIATSIIASGACAEKVLLTACFIEVKINGITFAFGRSDVLLGTWSVIPCR